MISFPVQSKQVYFIINKGELFERNQKHSKQSSGNLLCQLACCHQPAQKLKVTIVSQALKLVLLNRILVTHLTQSKDSSLTKASLAQTHQVPIFYVFHVLLISVSLARTSSVASIKSGDHKCISRHLLYITARSR